MATLTNPLLGTGWASAAVNVGMGSRTVDGWSNMLSEVVDSSRSLARSQPFWTNVSLPSGRTSLTVAWRSTLGLDDSTQRLTAPPPIAVVLAVSGAET